MRLPRSLPTALCCLALAAGIAAACGGDEQDAASAPDNSKIPTATLPADLPQALIIGGGAIQPGGVSTYTIRSGDTLAGIASRLGVSLDDLREANPGIDPATLQAGDTINLPEIADDVTPAPEATAAPATEAPATPVEAVPTEVPPTAAPVATDTPAPPEATPTASSLGQAYVVQSGDIPVNIAAQFGITVEALLAANPGINPNALQVGDVLIIPAAPPPGG